MCTLRLSNIYFKLLHCRQVCHYCSTKALQAHKLLPNLLRICAFQAPVFHKLFPWSRQLTKFSHGSTLLCFIKKKKTATGITYFVNEGCGRNSELIINKNNILLKIIDTSFSTSQFTMALNFFFFLHSFTFCVQCLLGGHHPPQCTGAHELRSCA